jgi:hypothetical protein
MVPTRAKYLMGGLLKNTISEVELNELLSTIGKDEMNEEFGIVLENYFKELMVENNTKKFYRNDILD